MGTSSHDPLLGAKAFLRSATRSKEMLSPACSPASYKLRVENETMLDDMEDSLKLCSTDRNVQMALLRQNSVHNLGEDLGVTESQSLWDSHRSLAVRALICYCVAFASSSFLENTFTLYAAALRDHFDTTAGKVSEAFTFMIFGVSWTGPIWAHVAETYGHRVVVFLAWIFTSFAYVGFANMTTLTELYMSYAFGGMVVGCLWAPCISGSIQLMPQSAQACTAALLTTCYQVGSLCLSPFLERLIREGDFRDGYFIQGMISFVLIGLSAAFLPDWRNLQREEVRESLDNLRAENDETIAEEISGMENLQRSMTGGGIGVKEEDATPRLYKGILFYIAYTFGATTYYFLEAEVQQIMAGTLPSGSSVRVIAVPLGLLVNGSLRPLWGFAGIYWRATFLIVVAFTWVTAGLLLWSCVAGIPSLSLLSEIVCFGSVTTMYVLMPVAIVRLFGNKNATFLCALFNTADSLAAILGAPVAAFCSSIYGWPATLRMFSVVPAVVALITLFLMPAEEVDRAKKEKGDSKLLKVEAL